MLKVEHSFNKKKSKTALFQGVEKMMETTCSGIGKYLL